MKILIMGLPGSGKTSIASSIWQLLNIPWYNADEIRKLNNDWDFTTAGRLRQAKRLSDLCNLHPIAMADFVCPTPETRVIFSADYVIWMNTIKSGRFDDTNKVFVPPDDADLVINSFEDVPKAIGVIYKLYQQVTNEAISCKSN
jgi:adenylylsulfate kinase